MSFVVLLLLVASVAAPAATAGTTRIPLSNIHPALQQLIAAHPDFQVPIIVQKSKKGVGSADIAQGVGGKVDDDFTFIDSFTMTVPARAIPKLAQNPHIRYISPDGPVTVDSIDTSKLQNVYPQVTGASTLWNAGLGLTGKGVTVAVVDSGVADHPDFGNRILLHWAAKSSNQTDANGHGTHVAGTIGGRSADGRYIGVAPDVNILAIKTTNDKSSTSEAGVVKALQWIYDHRVDYNIRVVNMSISAQTPTPYVYSPMAAAAEKVWQSGVAIVVAAGNRGYDSGHMWYAPANDPFVIAVGALDDNGTADTTDDSLAPFSSYGQTQNKLSKPDLVAPGRKIVAPLASTSALLAKTFPDRITPDGNYIRLSGTSMATPMVTGLIALMLERYPTLTPNQIKWALTSTTQPYAGQPAGTAGKVNVQGALDLIAQYKAAGNPLGEANQNALPSPQVALLANNTNWETTDYTSVNYNDPAYWDTAYWDTAYWDTAYWDTAYWDTYYSESSYMGDESAMWD